MSTEFQREDRYIVIKRSDLAKVPVAYRSALVEPLFHLQAHLPHRECLVLESDWPEYEPTWAAIEQRVTGKKAEHHQGEPVTLPARMDAPPLSGNLRGYGWNACLDEIAKLGPLYTQPAPGVQQEPVANCFLRKNGSGEWVNDAKRWEDGAPDPEILEACKKNPELYRVRLAYSSPADPGEVERLRTENESLRAGWYKDESDNNRYWPEELEEARIQLAERDALLARVVNSGALSSEQQESLEAECCAISASTPKCKTCHDQGEVFVRKGDVHYGMQTEPEPMMAGCPDCATPTIALSASAEPSVPASFQQQVQPWLMECFGAMIAGDREERNHRFLEEALELVQSLGCSAAEAHQLVEYVYGRAVGDPSQEVGGVMVTLAALCLANDLDMHQLADIELARVWTKVDQIREKQKNKPQVGPLPGVYPGREPAAPVERDERAAFEAWAKGQDLSVTRTPNALCFHNGTRRIAGDYIDLSSLCAYAAWCARAALGRKPSDDIPDFTPGNGNKAERRATALLAQLQADLTERDERIDALEKQVQLAEHWLEPHSFNSVGDVIEHTQEMRDEFRKAMIAAVFPDYVAASTHGRLNGIPDKPCSGCGTPGWTGACNKCVPY